MFNKLSYCGIICDGCPVYWATIVADKKKQQKMRAEIIRISKEEFGLDFKPEELTDCYGCMDESNKLLKASRECGIRKCAMQKGLHNCAYCDDYPCDMLQKFHKTDPDAKARLDVLRSAL
ncbi:DUF3795 domain-containing protein [candidate division KSB1 bacterium]|nr:DUF3795 domain-containing protein [candidate division KSB1 bacterium]